MEEKDLDWFKKAIIYALDVHQFYDSNGDGIGDLKGLYQKLDYLEDLGVNCLWLLPFFTSPNRDNGYDVSNYYDVDHRVGVFKDFVEFIETAKKRGFRIIIDLVIHHTSNEHPWFLAAREDKNSKYRDYYIWSKEPVKDPKDKSIFPDQTNGVWKYDEKAKEYYHHIFYDFQPDLNMKNPEVQDEMFKLIDFWLSFSVDGFRLDAASHMVEKKGIEGTEIENPGEFYEKIDRYIDHRRKGAIILAEADVEVEKFDVFFGQGERISMLYNFVLDNYLFLALAQQSPDPIAIGWEKTRVVKGNAHWANFLRNLDELDLERLSEEERETVLNTFAPDENMRIYNRGIRRRLAPMLGFNSKRLKMAYSILFSFPGAPVIPYGDEIAMGEDLSLKERNAVRCAMQWSKEANGGFSKAPKEKLKIPVIDEGEFSFHNVNVEDQLKDPKSFLNWFKSLIKIRHEIINLLLKDVFIFKNYSKSVFLHRTSDLNRSFYFIHNLSEKETSINLPDEIKGEIKLFFSDEGIINKKLSSKEMTLGSFDFAWIEVSPKKD